MLSKELTKAEARERTEDHRRAFKSLKTSWLRLGRSVSRSIDLGVPAKLGFVNYKEWLSDTFQELGSVSHILRQVHNVRALRHLPTEKLEAMPESSAFALAGLPEGLRNRPELVEQAISQKPAEFKATVAELRGKKLGETEPDKWKTYSVCLPIAVYEATIASDEKLARLLEVDISDNFEVLEPKKWLANRVLVAEAKAQLVNGTDETHLRVEIGGEVLK